MNARTDALWSGRFLTHTAYLCERARIKGWSSGLGAGETTHLRVHSRAVAS